MSTTDSQTTATSAVSSPVQPSSRKRRGVLPPLSPHDFDRVGKLGANLNIAWEGIWVNRLRSMLTTLGIFIGVAAVVAAMILTQGAGASIDARFSQFGPTTITVRNGTANTGGAFGAAGTVQSLTPSDAQAIQQQVPNVAYVSPVVSASEQIVFGAENENITVDGVSPDYQTIENWTLSEGLWFSTTDQAAGKPVTVIGQTVVQNLFTPSGTDPLNQTIRIGNQLFRVVGVLAAKGQGSSATADNVIFVPYTTALDRLNNSTYVNQILVAAASAADVTQVQQGITSLLEQRHHILKGQTDDFNTESSAQLLQTANQLTSTITLLLVGVASISLTVGGIGIMNIMIVSVTERTREIGIRIAIGAQRPDIRNQFLIEALTLSLVGGSIGVVLGLGAGYLATRTMGLPFMVSLTSILIPFLVSAAIGIIFGLYPAVRASQLDPIDALRSA
jgi:putative ABC transport system permease protein